MKDTSPLVSVCTVCKNGIHSVRRCVESVLAQSYPRVEYLIQDASSTDGTRQLLEYYSRRFAGRLSVVSESDQCAEEGYFRVLRRCRGEFIGSCWADEEMLPGAVAWAVENLQSRPDAGAVYGDMYRTDVDGRITGISMSSPFDLAAYLCREMVPPHAATFFRRSCLEAIGLHDRHWKYEVGESELWVRLGSRYRVDYVPGLITKYAVHPGQLSAKPALFKRSLAASLRFLDELSAEPGILDAVQGIHLRAKAGLYLWGGEILAEVGDVEGARECLDGARQYEPDPARFARLADLISPERIRLERLWIAASHEERAGRFGQAYAVFRRLAAAPHARQSLARFRMAAAGLRVGHSVAARRALRLVVADTSAPDDLRGEAASLLGSLAFKEHDIDATAQWFATARQLKPSLLLPGDVVRAAARARPNTLSTDWLRLQSLEARVANMKWKLALRLLDIRTVPELLSNIGGLNGFQAVHRAASEMRTRGATQEARSLFERLLKALRRVRVRAPEAEYQIGACEFHLGQIALESGATSDARGHFQRCLAVIPGHRLASEGLQRAVGPAVGLSRTGRPAKGARGSGRGGKVPTAR